MFPEAAAENSNSQPASSSHMYLRSYVVGTSASLLIVSVGGRSTDGRMMPRRGGFPSAVSGRCASVGPRRSFVRHCFVGGVIERDPQQMARVPCDQVASFCAAFGIFFFL